MKNIFKKCLPLVFLFPAAAYAQDSTDSTAVAKDNTEQTEKPARKEVRNTFENAVLINNQTVEAPRSKNLDFMIQHRFGVIKDYKDFWGFFAPSNIRLGLTYGINDRLSIGAGVTKNNYLVDLQWKYIILKQTKGNEIPLSLAYYGNLSRSTKEQDNFMNQENKYVADNRLSYFHELMVARKFGTKVGVQLAFTYSYFNLMDSGMAHTNYGISFAGRYKVSPQGSIMVDFDYPITKSDVNPAKPNLGFGYEIATSGHQFQIFFTTADAISNQYVRVYNQNDFSKKQFLIGFNITRDWGF
jgi:hypothetical protein